MKKYDFRLQVDDNNLGTVYLPDTFAGKLPVVVYCHGWRGNRSLNPSTQYLSSTLLNLSMSMVTFDFFGCGDTGGDYQQMTYDRWTSNLRNIFEWISCQEWADPQKVGCFGISSGTTAALRFAESSSEIAFVVSVATCLGVFIGMPNGPGKVLIDHWETLVNGGTAELFNVPFGLDFFRDFLGKAPVYNLKSISCPVFFLQGAADNIWRRSDAWIGYQILQKEGCPVKYLELEEGNHELDNVPEQCTEGDY